jgi:predicted acylesterase/phospholipase RssA
MPANGFEIARRLEAHAQAARGALADQTCRALASDSRIWAAWCAERNVSALPAEPAVVVAFVDAQAKIKSPATVRRYIATIAHMHRAAELADPTKAEIVRLAVKRLVRAKGSRQRQQCDVLLAPNVQHLGLLNWRAYDEAITHGYDCAVATIDRIKRHITDAPAAGGTSISIHL